MAQTISAQLSWLKWELNDADDMWDALKELTNDYGYRGQIHNAPFNGSGVNAYGLQVQSGDSPPVMAEVGQILVLMAGLLESLSQADYDAKYGG